MRVRVDRLSTGSWPCCMLRSPQTDRNTLRFGFDTAISQLLTVPPYVCASTYIPASYSYCHLTILCNSSALVLLLFAVWSDRVQKRSPFILAGLVMCLIGFAINISDAPIGVKYFGTFFCVSGSYAAFPGVVAWYAPHLVIS